MKHSTMIGVATVTGAVAVSVGLLAAIGGAWAGAETAEQPTAITAAAVEGIEPRGDWATDPLWYDGLVEKAVYDSSRVIYGRPRLYEATVLTNKENHEAETWTKDADGKGTLVEVWKHNKIEVAPTPNYDYKFVTTSHFGTNDLGLTRLDVASEEWCGASFKQYLKVPGGWDYFGFSYMPESGRQSARVREGEVPVVPYNGLSLWLRGYDFQSRPTVNFLMLPDQKSNRATPAEPVEATVTFAGETEDGYKLDVAAAGKPVGTFEMARDRRHVMLGYAGADGQTYALKSLDRINYWTIQE